MSKKPNRNVMQRWANEDEAKFRELARRFVRSEPMTLRLLTRGAHFMQTEEEPTPTNKPLP